MPHKRKRRKPTKEVQEPSFHIIGLGNEKDWEAGRGSLYYIEVSTKDPDDPGALTLVGQAKVAGLGFEYIRSGVAKLYFVGSRYFKELATQCAHDEDPDKDEEG